MLDLAIRDRVAEITLDHPKVNAFQPALVERFRSVLEQAHSDPQVGALLLSSRQPGVFSAGLDLKHLGELDRAGMTEFAAGFFGLFRELAAGPLPAVAAAGGHAIAGGALLLCACDRRLGSEGEYRVGLTEVALGVAFPPGVTRLVERTLGVRAAAEVLCLGELHGPQRARELGFFDRLVAPQDLIQEARAEAQRLAGLPGAALRQIRQALRGDLEAELQTSEENLSVFLDSWFSEDCRRARQSLLEKLGRH